MEGLTSACANPGLDSGCGKGTAFLVRYTPRGKPDRRFAGGVGRLRIGAGPADLAVTPEGKILLSGDGLDRTESGGTLGLTAGGAPIESFGNGGHAVPSGHLSLLPDGRIFVVGRTITRLRPDGSIDPTWTPSESGDGVIGIGLPNGGLVTAGSSSGGGVQLRRYLPDGSPDPAFGPDGYSDRAFDRYPFTFVAAEALAANSAGDIYVAGEGRDPGSKTSASFIGRWGADGTFAGALERPCGGLLATRPDDGLLAAGSVTGLAGYYEGDPFSSLCFQSRDAAGRTTTDASDLRQGSFERPLEIAPDGSFLVGGADYSAPRSSAAVLHRYLPSGWADRSFGQGGAAYEPELRCAGRLATGVVTIDTPHPRTTGRRDVIVGGAGPDRLGGKAGNDLICGRGGDDRLAGGAGRDLLIGNRGDDVLYGGRGRDRLLGGRGRDRLLGGPGQGRRKVKLRAPH